jgi:hypothetical protein
VHAQHRAAIGITDEESNSYKQGLEGQLPGVKDGSARAGKGIEAVPARPAALLFPKVMAIYASAVRARLFSCRSKSHPNKMPEAFIL